MAKEKKHLSAKEAKSADYISAAEARAIAKENRRITDAFEKKLSLIHI